MDKDVDAGKLKIMDANYLLFRLRSISLLDDKYKVTCRCPNCGTQFIHEVNLSDIPVEYVTKKKLENLKMELPLSKQKIDFTYPSLNKLINMGETLRDYYERFPDADKTEALFTASTILYIDKVNGHKLINEELEEWLDNLDIIDSRAIRDIISTLDTLYGFNEDIKTKCPQCTMEVTHGLPITSELFNPSK